MSIRRAYGARPSERGHPLPLAVVAAGAAVAGLAAWWASPAAGAMGGVLAWMGVGRGRAGALALLLLVGALAGWRSAASWDGLAPDAVGTFTGWAALVDDPQPFGGATRVVLDVEGERFEMWARGRALRLRVDSWRGGDLVRVHGTRTALDPVRRERVAWQHVVGKFDYEWAGDVAAGGPLARASNRVREMLERGARGLPGDDGALFRGLVIGDDRDQPPEMIARFRSSGLSHLTAVSGSNIAFVLAVAAPLTRRLRPLARWAATLGLIGWFVSLTRFEPSILRAGVMAAISATAFALGRERSPARVLWLAVTLLLLVDPLLVRSVGFQLSVGATAGVVILGPRCASRLSVLGPLALPVGITLGAQLGVLLPQLLVFGAVPVVSLPANLLAVPMAGAVMLYGLPAGLVSGAVPGAAPVVMFPCRVGVRWIDSVALLAARAEPGGVATLWCWAVVAALIALLMLSPPGEGPSGSAFG